MEERGIRIIGTDIAVATQLAGTITSDYPVWSPHLTTKAKSTARRDNESRNTPTSGVDVLRRAGLTWSLIGLFVGERK